VRGARAAAGAARARTRRGRRSALSASLIVARLSLIRRIHVEGYRSIHELELEPAALCALVGEASTGKSVLLEAIAAHLAGEQVGVELETDDGDHPPWALARAAERAVHPSGVPSPGHAALGLLRDVERRSREGERGTVLLIEEPELFLRPQAQRYLYRLLHDFAADGNQVLYSTHAPAFLNVARLEELAFVRHSRRRGTHVHRPGPLPWRDEAFELANEFDAERAELFLARGALLVEGRTEKLVFPFVFRALGHDVDHESISIVECGGKSRIPLFARVCDLCEIPYVAVHDRDTRTGGRPPIRAEQELNALIRKTAGPRRVVVLDPDFEGAAGLRGHRHKPEHAWEHFVRLSPRQTPRPLVRAAEALIAQLGR
jgi:predicted ATP-dependent endonuclease of OLD family